MNKKRKGLFGIETSTQSKCQHCHGTGLSPDWLRLGRVLRDRRMSIHASLREVAKRCGVSPTHLSDMERGIRSMGGPKARRVLEVFELCPENAFNRPTTGWLDETLQDRRDGFRDEALEVDDE